MCGRYALHAMPEVIALQFGLAAVPEGLPARYNIAPSQDAPVIRQDASGRRELVPMRWGLVPHWSKEPKTSYSTINAMAETVDTKPAYRTAFRRRRCLVPASGWFEWQATPRGKQPWYFRPRERELLAFAGLWER
jgi:putative SOS response-associated peptidase YedK